LKAEPGYGIICHNLVHMLNLEVGVPRQRPPVIVVTISASEPSS
jgi:hypothetical protein